MKTCLISLVSDQTMPNILMAKHCRPDFLLFITTAAMERKGKSQAILETLRLGGLDYSKAYHKLEVLEDSIIDLQAKVTCWLEGEKEEYQFIVNLTCGTKLMSIAAYDLFTDFGSEMVYVPIPRNEFLIPFPKRRPKEPIPLKDRLSVQEYLAAYGVNITNLSHLEEHRSQALSRRHITEFMLKNYLEILPLLQWFGKLLRPLVHKNFSKGYLFSECFEIENESQDRLISMLDFKRNGQELSRVINKSEWNYLRGGWLEERIFLALCSTLPEEVDIQLGIKCQNLQGNENEFDVLFTCDNVLYLVECKSLEAEAGSEERMGATINDFLYKLGALRTNFGLTPKAFLATTANSIFGDDGIVKSHIIERGRQFGTQIIPLLTIPDLEDYFRQLIKPL